MTTSQIRILKAILRIQVLRWPCLRAWTARNSKGPSRFAWAISSGSITMEWTTWRSLTRTPGSRECTTCTPTLSFGARIRIQKEYISSSIILPPEVKARPVQILTVTGFAAMSRCSSSILMTWARLLLIFTIRALVTLSQRAKSSPTCSSRGESEGTIPILWLTCGKRMQWLWSGTTLYKSVNLK